MSAQEIEALRQQVARLESQAAQTRERIACLELELQAARMQLATMPAFEADHAALLHQVIEQQRQRAAPANAKNRARWLKEFGVDDLPAAIRRAAFFHTKQPDTAGPWLAVASLWRPATPTERPTYRQTMESLLQRFKAGDEGQAAQRAWEGVDYEDLAARVDPKAWRAALEVEKRDSQDSL